LQGLLTRGVNKTQFSKRPEIIKILKICEQVKIDPIQLSLQFIKNLNIDFFIFGVGSVDQFNQVIDFLDEDISFDDFSIFASKDRDLIDPRSWTSKP
jgi:aryl-alcohol dehydrogenase-like predicted oxidoreductase